MEEEMIWIVVSLLLLIVLLKLYFPKIKGFIGERRVTKQLKKLPAESYKVLNDLMIMNDNSSSQIDHLVLSPYGLFVIETKTFTGWIHGNERADQWTQTIYRSKTRFRNPVKQNWGHVLALMEFLDIKDKNIFVPIIVFAGDAELKNVKVKTDVIYDFELFQTIMKYGNTLLSKEEIENIYTTLTDHNVTDKSLRKKHIKDVRETINEKKTKEKALSCPKCNGKLVVRESKHGKFYGCSSFPSCRYKKEY